MLWVFSVSVLVYKLTAVSIHPAQPDYSLAASVTVDFSLYFWLVYYIPQCDSSSLWADDLKADLLLFPVFHGYIGDVK